MKQTHILLLALFLPLATSAQSSNKVSHLVTKEESLGRPIPGADLYSLTTDANFKRTAYVVKRRGKELAVVDGVEGKEYDKVAEKNEMYFSPDGKHLAYVAKRGDRSLVVVDGVEGKSYSFIYDLFNPVFSPNSQHVAYIASTGPNDKWFAVLDGVEQKKYDLVEGLIFSPDGKKLTYNADTHWNRGTYKVVNGVESKDYSGAAFATFSPDGNRLAFSAFKWHPDRSLAVIDGKDGQEYEGSVSLINQIVFSPDSKHIAYAVQGRSLIRDGVPQDGPGSAHLRGVPMFSPDSRRLAYVAWSGSWMVVVDGKIFDDHQVREFTKNLTFSADSQHLAYVTRFDSPTNTGYDFAVLDGVVQKDSKNILSAPHFSPDGKRLVYVARNEPKALVAYGEFRGGEYDRFVTCIPDLNTIHGGSELRKPFALDPDGTLHTLALRNGEMFRVELKVVKN